MVELFPETLPLTSTRFMTCEHTTRLHICSRQCNEVAKSIEIFTEMLASL